MGEGSIYGRMKIGSMMLYGMIDRANDAIISQMIEARIYFDVSNAVLLCEQPCNKKVEMRSCTMAAYSKTSGIVKLHVTVLLRFFGENRK
jgi:hypothetical protein